MSKIFYDHLIIIEEITAVLDKHNLSHKERTEILKLIDETLHHDILDIILTHLPKNHHETFLTKFHHAPHDIKLISFLKEATNLDIEKEILNQANKTKKELLLLLRRNSPISK